jgi:hypothetical protein
MSSSPPTTGGVYKKPHTPPGTRSRITGATPAGANAKSALQRGSSLTNIGGLLDKPKRDFREEVQRIAKVKIPSRKNFKYFHKFENVVAETSKPNSPKKGGEESDQALPLLNSFSSHSCFLGVDNRKNVECQTEPAPILKQEFVDLKDYRKWGNTMVDPFVKDLRKILMSQKPGSIEQYVIAYCNARINGEPVPDTHDVVKETAVHQMSKKMSMRNNVNTKNSLIRVRSTKAKMDANLATNHEEEAEAHSDVEREATPSDGGAPTEDYHSLSDDNHSEISDASY